MNDTNNQEDEDESFAETSFDSVAECAKLKAELERRRKELSDLERKTQAQEVILAERYSINASLEKEVSEKYSAKELDFWNLTTKYDKSRKHYEELIGSLESAITEKTLENERVRKLLAREQADLDDKCKLSMVADNDTALLEEQVEELMLCLQEKVSLHEDAENAMEDLKARYSQLQNILEVTGEHLKEKSKTLEAATEELEFLRAEQGAQRISGEKKSDKEDSLFAEVEAGRKQTADNYVTMKNNYLQAKQACKAMTEEIRLLKAQRATIKKWQQDVLYSKTDNEEIVGKYKSRIMDLENKLKAEMKKSHESRVSSTIDPSNQYFESKLISKNEEMENLQIKIKDLSIKLRIQEDAQLNIETQMRFWRCKASSLEAQTKLSEDMDEKEHITPTVQVEGEKSTNVNDATSTLQNLSINEIVPSKKSLKFSEDTKDNISSLKKRKGQEYPVLYIPG